MHFRLFLTMLLFAAAPALAAPPVGLQALDVAYAAPAAADDLLFGAPSAGLAADARDRTDAVPAR